MTQVSRSAFNSTLTTLIPDNTSGEVSPMDIRQMFVDLEDSVRWYNEAELVYDTSPQLGGSLDVNGQSIVSLSNADINIVPDGTGDVVLGNFVIDADATIGASQDGYSLAYNHSAGKWVPTSISGSGGSSGATELVELSDVSSSTATNRFALIADGTNFQSRAITEADISDLQTYLADITSESIGDLSDVTITSAAQGDLLYRGASGWVNIGAGTSGQFFQTQGVGANPQWATPAGSGNVSNSGTPIDNQIAVWTDSTTVEGSSGLTYNGSALAVTGNVSLTGTVDGRDVANDGAKLDAIEAAADVTDATNVIAALSGATVTDAGSPASDDKILIQDTSDTDNLKYIDVSELALASHTHSTADITSGQFPEARIADEAVTLAKMAHIATDSFLGRDTTGTGDVEVLTLATARTLLNVENGADVTDETNVVSALDGATLTAVTPAATDRVLAQDASDSNNLKYIAFSDFAGIDWSDPVDNDIVGDANDTYNLGSASVRFAQGHINEVYVGEGLIITEASDHPITPAAGQAQLWVQNSATQTLQVTFDDGTDAEVLTTESGTSLTDTAITLADSIPFFDDSDSDNAKQDTLSDILKLKPEHITVAASDETTALTTGTGKVTFRMPYAFTLTDVRASVTTAPTGSALTVDINEGGTSILSTKLTIDATESTSTTAATAAVISDSTLADDAEITVDVDAIGSTVAGAGLKVTLIGYQT